MTYKKKNKKKMKTKKEKTALEEKLNHKVRWRPVKVISSLSEEEKKKSTHLVELEQMAAALKENDVMAPMLQKDRELMELSAEANIKFARQVSWQRTLKRGDIETLDKLTNSAMKRSAILAAAKASNQENNDMNITLTF